MVAMAPRTCPMVDLRLRLGKGPFILQTRASTGVVPPPRVLRLMGMTQDSTRGMAAMGQRGKVFFPGEEEVLPGQAVGVTWD